MGVGARREIINRSERNCRRMRTTGRRRKRMGEGKKNKFETRLEKNVDVGGQR